MSALSWTPDIRAAVCRQVAAHGLAPFILRIMPAYSMGWVHAELCNELDQFLLAVRDGKSPRLMISMPPRHGKSELASRMFPAYALGRDPDLSIIATSYSAGLASRMSRDVQRIMESEEYRAIFPAVRLPGKNSFQARTSEFFEIAGHKGGYRSAGVGGGITGLGGHILLLDDVLKDRASADSPTIRQRIWDWYTSTLYTRLAPGGGIIVINTRWHMDDLCGRLLAAEAAGNGDTWRVINFPAIAEQDEPHRRAGEALHPERYSLEQLEKIRAAVGSRDWEALYQQHPVPDEGAVFRTEWFRYYTPKDLPQTWDTQLISWDMTFRDGDSADFVVGQVWGRRGGDFYLLDQVRRRMGFTDTVNAFIGLAGKWPAAMRKLVEDRANGPAVIDVLKKHLPGIVPVEPSGSKTARAHAVTTLFEAGNVYFPSPEVAPWIRQFTAELAAFPAAAHDDQVDAMTQALRSMQQRRPLRLDLSLWGKSL